jgi:chromosome segregation ATPase
LEKGNFHGEIDKYAQLLEKEQTTKAEDLRKAEALQEELDSLVASKQQLLAEVDGHEKTISKLQEKMQTIEQQLTDRFFTELKEKTDLLAKETAKASSLNALINNLKSQESNVQMEMAKVKAEGKLMSDKYNRMTSEHSHAFSVSLD